MFARRPWACRRVHVVVEEAAEAVTPVGVIYVIRGLALGVAWGVGAWPWGEKKALAAPGAARE